MIPFKNALKRTTDRVDIGQIFMKENVQKLLRDITRFDETKVFSRRPVPELKTPQLIFMNNRDLEEAKKQAYENAAARLQMPPVMSAEAAKPAILSKDEELVGYTKFKIMFIDISTGYSNRNRLMSVREPDGTLRYPTYKERSRLNHMFYPSEYKTIDPPKLFEDEHMIKILKRKDYVYLLNRACIQFEPDDPRYVDITSKVYKYIDDQVDFDRLRSTRHFGPMSLFLAYNKLADNLIIEMLSKDLIEDAAKLVKIYNTCHNIE